VSIALTFHCPWCSLGPHVSILCVGLEDCSGPLLYITFVLVMPDQATTSIWPFVLVRLAFTSFAFVWPFLWVKMVTEVSHLDTTLIWMLDWNPCQDSEITTVTLFGTFHSNIDHWYLYICTNYTVHCFIILMQKLKLINCMNAATVHWTFCQKN